MSPPLYNLPGKTALSFRVGTYATFHREMLARLRVELVPDQPLGHRRPLATLLPDEEGWIQALVDAWAAVGDVLTFYQERIANEGFLRTATQTYSIEQLVAEIGYRPTPGCTLSTSLAFLARPQGALPPQVLVARGTAVRSLASGGGLPPVFETTEPLLANTAWTEIRPVPQLGRQPQTIGPQTTSLRFAGVATGLKPGSPLLLTGASAGPFFRTVAAVEPVPAIGITRVAWTPALGGSATSTGPQAFTFQQKAQLFGATAPLWAKQTDAVKESNGGTRRGGVARSDDGGRSWRSQDAGLPTATVQTLTFTPAGELLAGTAAGLFRGRPGGWTRCGPPLDKTAVQSLASGPDGSLYAGAGSSVYRSADDGKSWEAMTGTVAAVGHTRRPLSSLLPKKLGALAGLSKWLARPSPGYAQPRLPGVTVHALAAMAGDGGPWVFAGTDKGVFRSSDPSAGWMAANAGLPGMSRTTGLTSVAVRTLAAGWQDGQIFAGTDQGVFVSTDYGQRWQAAGSGLPRDRTGTVATTALVTLTDSRQRQRTLLAATAAGVYRSSDKGASWQAASTGLPPQRSGARTLPAAVSLLAGGTDGRTLATTLFAATGEGLFRSDDGGDHWNAVPAGPESWNGAALTALATAGSDTVAATPFAGFLEDQWPGFQITDGRIDLSAVVPGVLPGSWVVLQQSQPQPPPLPPLPPLIGIYQAQDVLTVLREGFTLSAKVTRIDVQDDGQLGLFDLRRSDVLVISKQLPLWESVTVVPLQGQSIEIDLSSSEAPTAGCSLSVQGKRVRASLITDGCSLLPAGGTTGSFVPPAETFQILAAPAGNAGWKVRLASGETGWLPAHGVALAFHPAQPDDEVVTQVATLLGTGRGATETTTLLLAQDLPAPLCPLTTRLNANVAAAEQGETVTGEVLGNGDASKAFQSFRLARKPLTYRLDTDGMPQSTLQVFVDGVAWQEVRSLALAGAMSQSYMVLLDSTGQATVQFGNGTYGARLTTGNGNVTANYRYGLWPQTLPSSALSLLQQRPQGVQGVTNPEPAPGATPAEPPSTARERAPLTVRTLGRVVSLSDYGDFARTYPGVAMALARPLWTDHGAMVLVTVAGPGGEPVSDALCTELVKALRSQGGAGQPVRVSSYTSVPFLLQASLLPASPAAVSGLRHNAESALEQAFGRASRQLGEGVASSQVITILQEVPGVLAVDLTALYKAGRPPGLNAYLDAHRGRWAAGRPVPAELLWLDLQGCELTVQGAAA